MLPLVDYLIVNETELAIFAGQDIGSESIDVIIEQTQILRSSHNQTIIVTLGAKGVVCVTDDNVCHVEGIVVDAIDTTGAGDCFTGALSAGISEGMQLETAIRFANTAASLSVQKLGASASMPNRDDVNSTYSSDK